MAPLSEVKVAYGCVPGWRGLQRSASTAAREWPSVRPGLVSNLRPPSCKPDALNTRHHNWHWWVRVIYGSFPSGQNSRLTYLMASMAALILVAYQSHTNNGMHSDHWFPSPLVHLFIWGSHESVGGGCITQFWYLIFGGILQDILYRAPLCGSVKKVQVSVLSICFISIFMITKHCTKK